MVGRPTTTSLAFFSGCSLVPASGEPLRDYSSVLDSTSEILGGGSTVSWSKVGAVSFPSNGITIFSGSEVLGFYLRSLFAVVL